MCSIKRGCTAACFGNGRLIDVQKKPEPTKGRPKMELATRGEHQLQQLRCGSKEKLGACDA